ncbi:hypothetical protein FGO68_gene3472 [Halteria grandinella]|uniref:MAPEG family protein n=1 Tax=Halteria grandinella TaxID=5974 RepID=A0A8J8NJ42_HALGN|nr:hypothetical protein FGO68_gene3472 [Halteria grandinella]
MHGLFCGAMVAVAGFYLQMQNTGIRKDTFARNYALIDKKFSALHKEALGNDQKINKYGYPDIGNNIYSELLPYRDWVRVNNAQRAHENLITSMIVFYPNAFIGLLVYPRLTLAMMYVFLTLRIWHIKGYLSFRGHNKATAAEEFSKLVLIGMVFVSLVASLRMLGVTQKLAFLNKMVPKRFRKANK